MNHNKPLYIFIMKIKSLITAIAVIIATLTAVNMDAQTAKKKATPSGISQTAMNSLKCNLLYGKVKSATVTTVRDGKTLTSSMTFNAKGQIISEKNSWSKHDYSYYTDKKYKKDGNIVVVTYGKNKRVDTDDYGERFNTTYTFNQYGQLKETSDSHDFMNQSTEYFYKTNDSKLPYKEIYSGGEGGEWWTTTYTYEYISTDAQGNWTKRKVTADEVLEGEGMESQRSSETYTETQKLIYF